VTLTQDEINGLGRVVKRHYSATDPVRPGARFCCGVDELCMERRATSCFFDHHMDLHDEFCRLYELVEEGKDPSTYYRRTE
jgi:hypothetical protein